MGGINLLISQAIVQTPEKAPWRRPPGKRKDFMTREEFHIAEIRHLATRFKAEEIEGCIERQIQQGENLCFAVGPSEHIISELSKAEFVRSLMEKGAPLAEALRELARRIRQIQKGIEEAGDKKQ